MKVQILIATLLIASSAQPSEALTEASADTLAINLFTRAINNVLAGIATSGAEVFNDHRVRFSGPTGFLIQGDIVFNGTRVEGLEDIKIVKDITIKDEGAYQRIRAFIRVPRYTVTSNVTMNVSTNHGDRRGLTFNHIVWGVESIADKESEIELSFNYFKKANDISGVVLKYSHASTIAEMQTIFKYPTSDPAWQELGLELEQYVKRYFREAPNKLLSWLSFPFMRMSLE